VWAGAVALQDSGRRRRACIWIAALALASACELRLFTLGLPLAAVVLLVGVRGWRSLRAVDWLHGALGAALVAVTAIMHLQSISPFIEGSSRRLGHFTNGPEILISPASLLTHADLTPIGLVIAALVGSFLLRRRGNARFAAASWLSFFLLWLPAFTVIACRTDLIRYQTSAQIIFCILAGAIGAACTDGGGRLQRPAVFGAVVALVVATAVPGWMSATRRTPDEAAFALVADVAQQLPERFVVRVAPATMGDGRIRSDFPEYLLESRGRDIVVEELGQESAAADQPTLPCYAFIGPDCYDFTGEELRDGFVSTATPFAGEPLRAECAPLTIGAKPGSDATLTRRVAVPWPNAEFHHVAAEKPMIGFFPCK
jgi:hypothetical protein